MRVYEYMHICMYQFADSRFCEVELGLKGCVHVRVYECVCFPANMHARTLARMQRLFLRCPDSTTKDWACVVWLVCVCVVWICMHARFVCSQTVCRNLYKQRWLETVCAEKKYTHDTCSMCVCVDACDCIIVQHIHRVSYIYIYIYIYIYTYIYTHAYARTHAHTQTLELLCVHLTRCMYVHVLCIRVRKIANLYRLPGAGWIHE